MKEIKACIRKFCSLPMEERYKSEDALRVEELTGYRLLNSVDKINRKRAMRTRVRGSSQSKSEYSSSLSQLHIDWKINPFKELDGENYGSLPSLSIFGENARLVNELKRSIVNEMKPLIKMMQTKKRDDIRMIEILTGCRPECHMHMGKLRYKNLDGKTISHRSYEKRYLAMVRQQRDERIAEKIQKRKAPTYSLHWEKRKVAKTTK